MQKPVNHRRIGWCEMIKDVILTCMSVFSEVSWSSLCKRGGGFGCCDNLATGLGLLFADGVHGCSCRKPWRWAERSTEVCPAGSRWTWRKPKDSSERFGQEDVKKSHQEGFFCCCCCCCRAAEDLWRDEGGWGALMKVWKRWPEWGVSLHRYTLPVIFFWEKCRWTPFGSGRVNTWCVHVCTYVAYAGLFHCVWKREWGELCLTRSQSDSLLPCTTNNLYLYQSYIGINKNKMSLWI